MKSTISLLFDIVVCQSKPVSVELHQTSTLQDETLDTLGPDDNALLQVVQRLLQREPVKERELKFYLNHIWLHKKEVLLKRKVMSGGSPGQVFMEGDSCSDGCGFESRHYLLDGHFSHIIVVKVVTIVWKDKNKRKRGWGWPFKKRKRCPFKK